ncbi:MAG: methionine synthase [Mediterranea sp.]|nr:methionine synthase [Mediterranea sp.]
MQRQELGFGELGISRQEVYEAMGYHDANPDAQVGAETDALLRQVAPLLQASYAFFLLNGEVDSEAGTLMLGGARFAIDRIIARQLRGSEAFALFVATAGSAFEQFQQALQAEGDMVRIYLADSLGSVIAERTADRMEEALAASIASRGWHHTNRYSPGYCGWYVGEQQRLFSLFPTPHPCGIHLTDSSLMTPIKSVSGLIGIGTHVRKQEYTCGLCDYKDCFRRRKPTR